MQTERLTTLDEHGGRRFVIPAEVTGPFRTWRNRVYFVLILIFLGLPWLKINGLQAIWIDIPNRRFEIFGQLLLAHDSPLIFLLLASLAMSLALVTAVWGRVWCGWACPQTVFIDGLYRKLEIWIEGDYKNRRRLQNSGLTGERLIKGMAKWSSYFVLSSLISHSLIAYFAGADNLVKMMQGSPEESWTYFLLTSIFTAILMFNFGWFREQFCTIMCPYGRFQSVLMDNRSLTVLYDEKRGEPRKGSERDAKNRGDCVSCNRCVEVCPAKIDIRQGVQMECIGCTACIDACNEIMKRVNKPPNLIRYASLDGTKASPWRTRPVVYMVIVAVCASILGYNIANHRPFSVTLLRAKDTPYQVLQDGQILNHMKAKFFNQSRADQVFQIQLTEEDAQNGFKLTQAQESHRVAPGQNVEAHFFVTFPKVALGPSGEHKIKFAVSEAVVGTVEFQESGIVGPRALAE